VDGDSDEEEGCALSYSLHSLHSRGL
jgi:hypothetical protein